MREWHRGWAMVDDNELIARKMQNLVTPFVSPGKSLAPNFIEILIVAKLAGSG